MSNSTSDTVRTDFPSVDDFLERAALLDSKAGGSFSADQIRAIHIVSLTCACISLLTVLVTLRWFVLMRRSFRHRLVMFLIISDTFKAFWYFLFPVVIFSRGPVASSSNFCQASGFLLFFAVAASDMAIFIIALHSIIYIMKPTSATRTAEGGLYPWRNWIYLLWLGPPVIAASIPFVNTRDGYVTAGTFCFLPKRPIWYRLALSWIPRYIIITLIILMYVWIYLYIHYKFRGFENLGEADSSYDSNSFGNANQRPNGSNAQDVEGKTLAHRKDSATPSAPIPATNRPPSSQDNSDPVAPPPAPWDNVSFITSRSSPASLPTPSVEPVQEEDVATFPSRYGSLWSDETQVPSGRGSTNNLKTEELARGSAQPAPGLTVKHEGTEEAITSSRSRSDHPSSLGANNEQLKQTRAAIRKQLRYLFIYPAVYILMWSFPFVAQAMNYDEYYIDHPVFWVSMLSTIALALQAFVDSVLFSWREKPWRKVDDRSKFSIPFLQRQSKAFVQKRCPDKKIKAEPTPALATEAAPLPKRQAHWWEAEGRRRNDSIWMGTSTFPDNLSPITTRTRTRSRSPEKALMPRMSHVRAMSSELQRSGGPLVAEASSPSVAPSSTPPATAQPSRRATLTSTSMSTAGRNQRHRLSLQTTNLSPMRENAITTTEQK
ncbi:hypothetical protein PV10_04902 [Exophiala mesophila]|uniref:G-protein coupled receptors family 1 profile domain-containing protein n=1 Tax=Exophiala mesophila TaxID=212818 RepID=A0A0D1XZL1_EXOME|nr:uncharacterized protein PV10_04902 [Exophiala mesophila]KIV93706.1 hypothetical protein PV10_04902 [Exophiala mesophila]